MASLPQIRGLILEEIALRLLGVNGYIPIAGPGRDTTLVQGRAGIEVQGRGCLHQIDAIADYRLSPPFSNPQRLLVEAKSLNIKVGVGIVRNAVGVLKDVSEFWGGTACARYHYQYAVFADGEFSKRAQHYAFAHDIYLFPLRHAGYLRPVIDALRSLQSSDFDRDRTKSGSNDLNALRQAVRKDLARSGRAASQEFPDRLQAVIAAARQVDQGIVAVAMKQLPLFLVPAPGVRAENLPSYVRARIRWDESSWYIDGEKNQRLFSFDLPEFLFEQYAVHGVLTRQAALELKENMLAKLQATIFNGNEARVVEFELDGNWINQVRETIAGTVDRRKRE